jgi:hypothetical protein
MSASIERIDDQAFYAYAHPKRRRRFYLAVVFATLLFPLIAALLIAGTLFLIVPFVALLLWMSMRVYFARLMGNAVLVGELNYPRIHAITGEMKQRLGYLKRVDVFVYEEGQFNASLLQFFFRRAVLLNSEIVEKGVSDDEVRWLVGRFVGYLRARKQAGALGWLIRAAQHLVIFNVFLLPYERSMVSTGDRLAVAAINGDVSSAISALQKLFVGRKLGYSLNPEGMLAQHRLIKGTFFGLLARLLTAFPHLTARYVDVMAFAKIYFPDQYAKFLAANPAMPDDLLQLADLQDTRPEPGARVDTGMAGARVACAATLAAVVVLGFVVAGEQRNTIDDSYAYDSQPYPDPAPTYDPVQDPTLPTDVAPDAATAKSGVSSREAEALAAGYEVDQAWSELTIPKGHEGYVEVDGQLDNDYLVLARGSGGCDVDAVVSDDIKDDGPAADAAVNFVVTAAGTVRVSLPVSTESEGCIVGLGVYRKSATAIAASD